MHLIRNIPKVILGISGGVDSCVSAILLKRKGFDVTAVFMKNWNLYEDSRCTIDKDLEDAKYICDKLSIPFREVNFVKDYWNSVFTEFLTDYVNGLTPNPDVLCNKNIKFDKFFHFAREILGATAIATGHYAKTTFGEFLDSYNPEFGVKLLKASDSTKDQTYFLSQISQKSLQRTMFPLSNLTKIQVKNIANDNNFQRITKKKESYGICFIGPIKLENFLENFIEPKPGQFIDIDTGNVIGKHNGIHNYTLGQRCRISGYEKSFYVSRKCPDGKIYVGKGHEHPSLYSNALIVKDLNWIHSVPAELKNEQVFTCDVRHNYQYPLIKCRIIRIKDSELFIELNKSSRAINPGQYTVFYKGNECLGSAKISYVSSANYILTK